MQLSLFGYRLAMQLSRYLYRRIEPVKPINAIVVKNVSAPQGSLRESARVVDTPRAVSVQSSVFPPVIFVLAAAAAASPPLRA